MKKINKGEQPMDGSVLNQAKEIVTKICVLGGGAAGPGCPALLRRAMAGLSRARAQAACSSAWPLAC